MKLDPSAIKSKSFSKRTLGGLDGHEVSLYLEQLSNEWVHIHERNQELETKLEKCNSQVQRLRELENALLKELDEIRKQKANHIGDAKQKAELIVQTAETNAQRIMNNAKLQAHKTVNEAEIFCKNKLGAMQQQLRSLVQQYHFVDAEAKQIVSDLSDHLSGAQDKAEKLTSNYNQRKQHVSANTRKSTKPQQTANKSGKSESPASSATPNQSPNKGQAPPKNLYEKLLRDKKKGE